MTGDARLEVVLDAKVDVLIDRLSQVERKLKQFGDTASEQAKKARAAFDKGEGSMYQEQMKMLALQRQLGVAQAANNSKEIKSLQDQIAAQKVLLDLRRRGVDASLAQTQASIHLADLTSARATAAAEKKGGGFFGMGFGAAGGAVAKAGEEEVLAEGAGKVGVFGAALKALGPAGLVAAGAIGAVGLATEKFLETTEHAIDAGAEIAKTSKELGVSSTFLQEFHYAAKQSDIDIGAADEALKGLNESLGAVNAGLPRAKGAWAAFHALGFSKEDLKQYHNAGELFAVLSDRIMKMGTDAEKAALAKKLGMAQLLPMLKEGQEGFNKMAQRARELGLVMDEVTVQKAEEAKKKLNELHDVVTGKLNTGFVQFADTLIFIKTKFAEATIAGLHFLGYLTNTLSHVQRLIDLQKEYTAIQDRLASGQTHGMRAQRDRDYLEQLKLRIAAEQKLAQEEQDRANKQAEQERNANAPIVAPETKDKAGADTARKNSAAEDEASRAYVEAKIKAAESLEEEHKWRLAQIESEHKAAFDKARDEKGLTEATRQMMRDTADMTRGAATKAEDERYRKVVADSQRAFDDSMQKMRDDMLKAQQGERASLQDKQALALQRFNQDQEHARRDLDDELRAEKDADTVEGQKKAQQRRDQLALTQKAQTDEFAAKQAQERLDAETAIAIANLKLQAEDYKAQLEITKNVAKRKILSEQILAIEQRIEDIEHERELGKKGASPEEIAQDRAQRGITHQAQNVALQHDPSLNYPLHNWAQEAKDAAQDLQKAFEDIATKGLDQLNAGLAQAIVNSKSLGQVFKNVMKQMETDLIQFLLKQAETQAFTQGGSIFKSLLHFAEGTRSAPGGLAVVGERGPEVVHLPHGSQVIPNKDLTQSMRGMTGAMNITRAAQSNVYVSNDLRGVVGDAALDAKIAAANQKTAGMIYDSVKRAMPGWQVDYSYEQGR
jgi:hypothetical protein